MLVDEDEGRSSCSDPANSGKRVYRTLQEAISALRRKLRKGQRAYRDGFVLGVYECNGKNHCYDTHYHIGSGPKNEMAYY